MAKKLKPGDYVTEWPSTEWNRHCDASDAVLGRGLQNRQNRISTPDTNFVILKNSSGADRRQGEILEFTGLDLTDLTSRQKILTGGSPTLVNDFAVLNAPI